MIIVNHFYYEILSVGFASTVLLLLYVLYLRVPVDTAYLRTGLGKPKVLLGSGGFVIPFLHTLTPVNLQTYSFELVLQGENSLVSKDLLRVDVQLVFGVRVAARQDSIQIAARVLGEGVDLQRGKLQMLLEAEGTSVLRGTAVLMSHNSLHQQRHDFTETVNRRLNLQLQKYGLEVVSTALVQLEQTAKSHYDPKQVLDAQGLLRLEKAQFEYEKQRQIQRWAAELATRRHEFDSALQRMAWERDEFSARLQHIRYTHADVDIEPTLASVPPIVPLKLVSV